MKKTCYLYIGFLLVLICYFSSCRDHDFLSLVGDKMFKDFSLEEAKSYFREMAEKDLSSDTEIDRNLPFFPGNIVPQWESAILSVKKDLACYDIPFNGTYFYQVINSEECAKAMIAEKVKVYQKLIIVKDIQNKKLSQYILSLIPNKAYELQNEKQVLHRFITCGDKGNFSGIAVYSKLYTWQTARVDTYKNGERVKEVFLLDAKNDLDFREKIEKAQKQFYMLSLQKKKRILSRGEYDIDGGWLDEVVVTPDNPWDDVGADGLTMEEWLDQAFPDGDVDPQPDEPIYPEWDNDDDYNPYNEPEPNIPNMSGFDYTEQSCIQNAVNKVAQLVPSINMGKIYLIKGQVSSGNAGINKEGQIILFDRFFKILTNDDRPAVLFHEIYHLQHGHNNVSTEKIQVEEKMNEPPIELKQIIMEDIKMSDPNANKETLEVYYQDFLSVYTVRYPEFYENELETYKAERLIFPDNTVSGSYKIERQKAEWEYQEKLEISRKNK